MVKEKIIKLIERKKFNDASEMIKLELAKGTIIIDDGNNSYIDTLKRDLIEGKGKEFIDQRWLVYVKEHIKEVPRENEPLSTDEMPETPSYIKYYVIAMSFVLIISFIAYLISSLNTSEQTQNQSQNPTYINDTLVKNSQKTLRDFKEKNIEHQALADTLAKHLQEYENNRTIVWENKLKNSLKESQRILRELNEKKSLQSNTIKIKKFLVKKAEDILLELKKPRNSNPDLDTIGLIKHHTTLLNKYKKNPTMEAEEELGKNIETIEAQLKNNNF